jgi:hypothetical protein
MDLAKLIGLLDSRRLHLTRLDRMEDPLEGGDPAHAHCAAVPAVETPLGVRAILAAARNSYRMGESASAASREGAASHPSRPRGPLKPRSGGRFDAKL